MALKTDVVNFFKEKLLASNFGTSHFKLKFNELSKIPTAQDKNRGLEYWGGIYHIFNHNHKFALYACNTLDNTPLFIQSDFDWCEFEPTVEERSPDDILKDSKKVALSDPKFTAELEKIQGFIDKVKNNTLGESTQNGYTHLNQDSNLIEVSKPSLINQPIQESNKLPSEAEVKELDILFKQSYMFDNKSVEYPELFWGISNCNLNSIRKLHSAISITDSFEESLELKQGTVVFKYNDHPDFAPVFVVKDSSKENCYTEKYICSNKPINFKVFGEAVTKDDQWLFVATDFLSANAIYTTTNVKTIAISSDCSLTELYKYIRSINESVKVCHYRATDFNINNSERELILNEAKNGFYNAHLESQFMNWCDYRQSLFNINGVENGEQYFKKALRDALSNAVNYL